MTPEVQALFDVMREVGFAALFAWLYIAEKRDRTADRIRHESELSASRSAHMADIREIAGMRQSLFQVGTPQNPAVPRDLREALNYPAPPPKIEI